MFWNEELKNNMTDVQELRDRLGLDDEKMKRMKALCKAFPMSIPRYYLSLIDWDDPEDPIRRMCIPALLETDMSGAFDTSGEAGNTVCVGVQHKYRESALILTTNRCAMYCRHCFRKRLVGLSDDEIARHFDEVAGYVREHKEITNVILSGGDTLMLPTRTVVHYLETLSRIAHLDLIRIATRMPVVYPMRITKDRSLLKALTYYGGQKQIYVVTQFNHPRELTPEARAAVRALLLCGLPVKNQTVLLRGVNDSPQTLGRLLRELTACGVTPYYVFQCRPVSGVKSTFQLPLSEGYDIVEAAKAVQNGQGKCLKFCMSHPKGKIEIAGKFSDGVLVFKFHQAKNDEDAGRTFVKSITKDTAWLPDEF